MDSSKQPATNELGFTKAIAVQVADIIDGGGCLQICVIGPVRSGKSLTSIKLGELFAPMFGRKFDASFITHEPDDFLRLLASDRMSRGSVAVLDEAGIAASNRTWYSKTNFAITQVVQSFGHKGYIVIYNLPHLKFLDPHIVRLFNVVVKTAGRPKRAARKMWARWYWWRVEPETGKIMRLLPRWKDKDGKHVARCLEFDFPEQALIEAYVAQSNDYKNKVLADAQITVQLAGKAERSDRVDAADVAEKVLVMKERYVRANGKVDTGLVEADFGIGGRKSQQVKSLVESRLKNTHVKKK